MKTLDIFKAEDFEGIASNARVTEVAHAIFNKWLLENNIDISHLVPCEHAPVYVGTSSSQSWFKWRCYHCDKPLKADTWSVIE